MNIYSQDPSLGKYPQGLHLHNQNQDVLDTFAILLGCYECFVAGLPDGKKPDVMRYSSKKKLLFLGDAKNTETPGNKYTQERLFAYLLWFSAYLSSPGRKGIFAICFGDQSDLQGWIKTIFNLAYKANICFSNYQWQQIDTNTNLLWFYGNIQ